MILDPTVSQVERLRKALVLTGHATGESLETFGADFVSEAMRLVDWVNARLPEILAPNTGEREKALEEAKAEIEDLQDQISDIEGVWPKWAENLLKLLVPAEDISIEDEFDLPQILADYLAEHRNDLEKACVAALTAGDSNG